MFLFFSRLHTAHPSVRAAAAALTALAILAGQTLPAGADAPPIPQSDYPPSTRVEYFPNWTNKQFDCNFGWNCESETPFLHAWTEDAMHRRSGWAMWGHWHDDVMGFELYSSVYTPGPSTDTVSWNHFAARDELVALKALNKAKDAKTIPAMLPCGVNGKTFAEYVDKRGWHVFFLTVWWGPYREIEAAALYPTKKKWEARAYLIQQVRLAVRAAMAADQNGTSALEPVGDIASDFRCLPPSP